MHCWQRLCIRGHRVVRITPCPPGGDPGAPGLLGGECLLHEDHASRPLLRPVSRGQTSPVCCIRRLPASLSICGQQPSLARQVVPVLFPDGAVSVFLLHFSRGVLQEGPFFSPGCVLPFLRVSVGTVAGVLARCYWWYPFTCTVYVDAPDSARGPLAEDPVRPAQSDVRLGVLSSRSETCPGGCGGVAGRTEAGACARADTSVPRPPALALHPLPPPPRGHRVFPCSGPGGPCGVGSELPRGQRAQVGRRL